MKHPNIGQNMNGDNEQDSDIEAQVISAQNRAIRAQQEAIELRQKLEGLEQLLANTREKLATANSQIEARDKQILNVQEEAKALTSCVSGLEERFSRLRQMQNALEQKRREFGLD